MNHLVTRQTDVLILRFPATQIERRGNTLSSLSSRTPTMTTPLPYLKRELPTGRNETDRIWYVLHSLTVTFELEGSNFRVSARSRTHRSGSYTYRLCPTYVSSGQVVAGVDISVFPSDFQRAARDRQQITVACLQRSGVRANLNTKASHKRLDTTLAQYQT